MIRVIIADDHPLVREGLKRILQPEQDIQVQYEASNGDQLLELVREHGPDLVVLDLTMPGKNGLDVLKELRVLSPKLPVVVLSMHPEARFAVRAIRSGASAYITKENTLQELAKAIRAAVSGNRYITPAVGAQLARVVGNEGGKAPHDSLSDREYQVFCLLAAGKSVAHVADELFLSTNTVNTYRSRIFEKLGAKSNVELTLYAFRNGIID